jgi:hypothetical protein
MKTLLCAASLFVVAVLSQAVLADDIVPAPWRGQPNTTCQVWEFGTAAALDVYPDGTRPGALPPGPSTRIFHITPNSGSGWLDSYGGRQGVWPLSGLMELHVENYVLPNPYKEMWLQITWREELTGGHPVITDLFPAASSPPELVSLDYVLPWTQSTYRWYYSPNPDYEDFLISGDIYVDELIVETRCYVPEPATAALLGLGSAAALALRRRRR